jgi:hypothetical protein
MRLSEFIGDFKLLVTVRFKDKFPSFNNDISIGEERVNFHLPKKFLIIYWYIIKESIDHKENI